MKLKILSLFIPLIFTLASCDFSPKQNSGEQTDTPDTPDVPDNPDAPTPGGDDNPGGEETPADDPMKITEPYEKVDASKLLKWDTTQASLRSGTKTLDFYNLNDTHGAVEDIPSNGEPGISKLSTFLKNQKSKNEAGYVFTSSGDMWQGSADSNITMGRLVDEWMEHNECSAMALGNHEFDWTINTIVKNDNLTKFDFVCCNIIDKSKNAPVDWAKPFTTVTKNGVNIGIIGAIGEGITGDILSSYVNGLRFDKIDNYVTNWSNYLKSNGADVVLLLLHSPVADASDLVRNKVVDAVFGGHSHQEEHTNYNGIHSIQSSCNGKMVGHISLSYNFATNLVTSITGENFNMANYSLTKDEATETIYNRYLENEINEIKNEIVGYTSKTISRTEVLQLLLEFMYKFYQEEIHDPNYVITRVTHNNARAEIPAGNITFGNIYKALPFDNCLVIIKKQGSKFSYGDYGTHYYPNGSNLDPNKYYYVLTINYIADYEHTDEDYTIEKRYQNIFMRDIFKKYIPLKYPKNN
ncbi:MAG: metallophosphoesterase [Bacilli bacterium]|nr:metallophosphoesterase [Bacilli bacterium]